MLDLIGVNTSKTSVITYTGHEETKGTTETETHRTRDDGLHWTRLHTSVHLSDES